MADIDISKPTKNSLIASFLPGIGKATLWRIVSRPEFFRAQGDNDLAGIFPELAEFSRKGAKYDLALKRAEEQIDSARGLGCHIIGFWDSYYPQTFRRASLAPGLFWYLGDPLALKKPSVAVIGTRYPTKAGVVSTKRVTAGLAEKGFGIVSGLALGVDSVAHTSALDAGGITIAVLPGGVDQIAPRSNLGLADRIVSAGGGLMSEYRIGTAPFPANFVARDATQAALSIAVVLMQSGEHGGSLHASRAIIKLRRKLIVASPTLIDLDNAEPKIEVNKMFLKEDFQGIVHKLKFPEETSSYSYLLHGKHQYEELYAHLLDDWKSMIPLRSIDDLGMATRS